MLSFEAHHYEQSVGSREHARRFFRRFESKINSLGFGTFQEFGRPVGIWPNNDDFQVAHGLDFPDERAQHSSIKIFHRAYIDQSKFSIVRRRRLFRPTMSARHRVNHVTVGMRAEHLLHSIAGAKDQITLTVKPPEPAA